MELGVQWFIATAVRQNILSTANCRALIEHTGDDVALLSLAQVVLDSGLSTDLDTIQNLVDYAVNQARSGQIPSHLFSIDSEIPSLEGAARLSDGQAAELMAELLQAIRVSGASDLHLSACSQPFVRRNLVVEKFGNYVLTAEDSQKLNTALLSEEQKALFEKRHDLDFAMSLGDDESRVRANLMVHKDGVAGSYRIVPDKIRTLEELGFSTKNSATISKMLDNHNGLILVTGPVNSGKTTTLAALVDIVNRKRKDHVIMVEDPLEIVQKSLGCNITQREVGAHTKSFATALKGALREDPDVIVIGELRDLETIEMAITASETGHLVIGTLHTIDASSTLNRLLDVFPPSQQQQIRTMTAGSLRGIICQKLLPRVDSGVVAACEVLTAHIAVSNLISEGKTHQLKAVMQTGSRMGMCTMDQSVYELFENGYIAYETTVANLVEDEYLRKLQTKLAVDAAAAAAADAPKKKGWFK